jgi:anti-sigma regulatory factor (Ser/Thr protein kinase)
VTGSALTLDPVPASVPAARAWVRERLRERPEYALDVVLLCLSELATNALLHARTPIRITLVERRGVLRVEVADSGDRPVDRVAYVEDRDAESGRGLQLVSELSSSYGIDANRTGAGVTAWFEVMADAGAGLERHDVTA